MVFFIFLSTCIISTFFSLSLHGQWEFQNALKRDQLFLDQGIPESLQTPIPQSFELKPGHNPKDQFKAQPRMDFVSAPGQSQARVQRWDHSSVREAAPVMSWGPLDLRSDLSHQGQSEMIPLADFSSLQIDPRGSISGPSAQIQLGQLQNKGVIKTSYESMGTTGLHLSSGDRVGNKIATNISKTQNQRRYYHPERGQWQNPQNDDEEFASLNWQWKLDQQSTFSLFHSQLRQGVSGSVYENYQKIEEKKSMTLIGAHRSQFLNGILWEGEFGHKNFQTELSDPRLESQRFGKNFEQAEKTLAMEVAASAPVGVIGEWKLKLKGDKNLFENGKQSQRVIYKRTRIGPEIQGRLGGLGMRLSGNLVQDGLTHREYQFSGNYLWVMSSWASWNNEISTTLRAPTLLQLHGNDALYEGNPNLREERFIMFKSGVTIGPTKLSVYHERPRDLIVARPSSFASWKAQNVNKAWISGIALSLSLAEEEGAPFDLALSGYYQEALNATAGINYGQDLPMQPRWKGKWKVGKQMGNVVTPWVGGEAFDEYSLDEGGKIRYPGTHLENVGVDFEVQQWQLSLSGQNIFNQTTGNVLAQNLVGGSQRQLMTPDGELVFERNFQAEVSYVF